MTKRRRYLKQRGNRWWFQIAVPERCRASIGKAVIEENLRTSDLAIAQTKANDRAAHWQRQFDLVRSPAGNHPSTIFRARLAETVAKMEWIDLRHADEEDRDTEYWLLYESVLDPELRRLGYLDASEIRPGDLDPEVEAAAMAVKAAIEGRKEVPKEFQTPFSKLADDYLSDRQRDPRDRLTAQTIAQMEATFRLFRDHHSDGPLSTVDKKIAADFLNQIGKLNRNWGRSPRTKARSLAQLLTAAGSDEERVSNRTIVRHASALAGLWHWAVRRGEVDGPSPFEAPNMGRHRRAKNIANQPWEASAIRSLMNMRPDGSKTGRPDPMYWLPRVALLTGMRLGEICELEVQNVREADGVTYFDIPKGKAEGSIRVVPVHPDLKALLKLAPEEGYLFPELSPGGPDRKRSWNVGKKLGRSFRALDGASTFHGFRKNVAEAFERMRVPESEASQLLGHKQAGMTYGVYSPNGLTIQQKAELIGRLSLTPSQ